MTGRVGIGRLMKPTIDLHMTGPDGESDEKTMDREQAFRRKRWRSTENSSRRNRSKPNPNYRPKTRHVYQDIRKKRGNNNPLQSLNVNLDSIAKSSQKGAAARAQELLQRIEALHQDGYYAVAPDTVSYNSVLNAWALSDEPDAPDKALQFLLHEVTEPSIISFNTVILSFAKRGRAREAALLMQKMQDDQGILPDTISYNSLLHAYAQSGKPEHAEAVLKEMMQLSQDSTRDVKPDTISFNTVLHAWSTSFQQRAANRSEELLRHMETLYKSGNRYVVPDAYSYTSVIHVWALSRDKSAASRALKTLDMMEEAALSNPGVKPTAVTYTCVMTALSTCGHKNAAEEAEKLLARMIEKYEDGDEDCKPDVVAFTAAMSCWARSGKSQIVDEKALSLLERMKQLTAQGYDGVAPNALTYTSVLKALVKSQKPTAPSQAEQILEEMEAEFQAGNADVEPTTIHYNVVMDTVARSPVMMKAGFVEKLHQNMLSLDRTGTQPDIITYNTMLRACCHTFGDARVRDPAMGIIANVIQIISKSKTVRPDSVTCLFFIKGIGKLVHKKDPKRLTMLESAVQYCGRRGLMNDLVLDQVKAAVDNEEELAKLLKLDKASSKMKALDLPKEWTKNSRPRRHPLRTIVNQ